MQDSYHKHIFDRYIQDSPDSLHKIDRWINHNQHSIKIFYKDGSKAIYHGILKTLRGIRHNNGSESDWKRDFRDTLVERMSDCGYTQAGLAKAAGLSQQSFSIYLNKKAIPSAYVICKLAKALGCTPNDLIWFKD